MLGTVSDAGEIVQDKKRQCSSGTSISQKCEVEDWERREELSVNHRSKGAISRA